MAKSLTTSPSPSWLADPPDGEAPSPPVTTRVQLLPFGALTWQDFERLCLRIARLEGKPDHWQLYGDAGEEQGGIDIYLRLPATNKYVVWQAKRHKRFTVSKLKAAVKAFLNGGWSAKSDRFVLCTAASLRTTELSQAIEAATAELSKRGIAFVAMDAERLSERLKDLPDVVDDFFDRPWVARFCGQRAAEALGARLGRRDLASLRTRLAGVYAAHFASVDPGVIRAIGPSMVPPVPLPLSARFVLPDLYVATEPADRREGFLDRTQRRTDDARERAQLGKLVDTKLRPTREPAGRYRQSLEVWGSTLDRSIVVGPPGAGKSTLLRFLALDLLAPEPMLPSIRERWPGLLPIWISFPFWTRQIAGLPAGRDSSVEGAIARWLDMQGETGLIDLVERALSDGQVLLLVDGVDEWADETSAQTAITLLNGIVQRRRCPVVVTSRPYGHRILRTLDVSWQRRELAPLTQKQQIDFATTWFEAGTVDSSAGSESRARSLAQAFIKEVQRTTEIAELAGVPLLLGGLIALRLSGAALPRNRFRAYAELTDRLLNAHPTARDQASLRPRRGDELDKETRERVLCALAYHIQIQIAPEEGLDAIPKNAAIEFCKKFLEDNLELPGADALRRASQLIELGEQNLGILVPKTQQDVGFLHRAFQEFLAAKHLSTMDLPAQIDLFRRHATEPRWREIILFAVSFLSRVTEVDQTIEAIEACRTGNPTKDWSIAVLLADIAFGSINRRPETVRRLTTDLFREVESGSDPRLRSDILQRAVGGLSVETTAALVRDRLRQWFPSWHDYNTTDCLRLIADWKENEVDDVLWRNLSNLQSAPGLQAARSLAKRHAGDSGWMARLLGVAQNPQNPETCAAAITALVAGWSEQPVVSAVIEAARVSGDVRICIAGIRAAIELRRQTEADLDRLLGWLSDSWSIPDGVAATIAAGWRHSPLLKSFILRGSLSGSEFGQGILWLAFKAFPQDDEIAEAAIKADVFGNHLFALHDLGNVIAENFKGHPKIGAAIEARLDDINSDSWSLAKAAQISPTPTVKALLLQTFKASTHLKFWQAQALIDQWGLTDPEVSSAFTEALSWPIEAQAEIADHLPKVMADKAACRDRLLSILRLSGSNHRVRADFALAGVATLGLTHDPEMLAAALKLDLFSDSLLSGNTSFRLITAFPKAPSVIALALKSLRSRDGLISVMALCQGDNAEVRRAILEVAAPLEEGLRLQMVDWLMDRAIDDDAALEMLDEGARETATAVITVSMIAAARARRARGDVDDGFIDHLRAELKAIGPVMDSRRFGALGALMILDRSDTISEVILSDERGAGIRQSYWSMRANADFSATVAEHWGVLERATGEANLSEKLGLDDGSFFEVFSSHLDKSPEIQRYARLAYDRISQKGSTRTAVLLYGARIFPNSPEVLDRCLAATRRSGHSWNEFSPAMSAAELIGRNFSDSDYAFGQLTKDLADSQFEGALAALCEGWPQSAELDAAFQKLADGPESARRRLHTPLALKLIATKSRPQVVADQLTEILNHFDGSLWDGYAHWTPNMVRRLQADDELYDILFGRLNANPSPSEKASFTALIAMARGYSGPLLDWCSNELIRARTDLIPQAGLDVTLGAHCLVPQRLRDLDRLKLN